MAARVTDADVKKLIATSLDTSEFIAMATLIVDEELADQGMSSDRLTKIELNLAAHFTALSEEKGGLLKESIDESSATIADAYAKKGGLEITRFGQQAITLDSSGKLASMTKNKTSAVFTIV